MLGVDLDRRHGCGGSGAWWKRLHRAIYGLGVVALLHYFIQSKSNVSEPVFFAGLFVWLMLWRALPMGWQRSVGGAAGLTRGGGAARPLASSSPGTRWRPGSIPWRVLAANESVSLRAAPGALRGAVGLGVTLLAAVRRAIGLLRPKARLVVSRT